MSQQNNPFAKFVKDPRTVPDPKTITIDRLSKYHSLEMQKFDLSMKNHRRSLIYLGGCLGLMLVGAYIGNKGAKEYVFGADNTGGRFMDLKTQHDEGHYAYNREFQRMMVLSETHVPDVSTHNSQLLTDLGVELPRYGNNNVPKRAPHEKYY